MTVAERQAQLREDLLIIEDRQERLAVVVDRARRRPRFDPAERTDAHRVAGCQTPVWIVADVADGILRLRSDCDSPMIRGLVALLCDVYDNTAPADAAATEPTLIADLGLDRDLSPTRQAGLRAVRAKIKSLAASA